MPCARTHRQLRHALRRFFRGIGRHASACTEHLGRCASRRDDPESLLWHTRSPVPAQGLPRKAFLVRKKEMATSAEGLCCVPPLGTFMGNWG
jgi:hypothetical protein